MIKNKKIVICFIGNDGSGKSTQIKKLLHFFERKNYLVETIHLEHFLLKIPKMLNKKKCFSNKGEVNQSIKLFKYLKGNKIFSLIFPIIIYIDFIIYYFLKIVLSKKQIIIFDRYFYDKLIKYMDLNVSNKFLSGCLFKITPRPAYIFYLDISPQLSLERKGEMNLEILNKRKKMYEKFGQKYHFIKINADEKPDVVFNNIIKKLEGIK